MDSDLDVLLGPESDEELQANRWEMEERFARYDSWITYLLEKMEWLEDAEHKNCLTHRLWQLRYRLMQGPVRLLIVGASSAGKSTLVNALAGSVVSPEGEWTTTCVPSWITTFALPRPDKAAEAAREGPGDGEPECYLLKPPGDPPDAEGVYRTRHQYLSLFCKAPGQEVEHGYYAVRIECRGGFLAESGITLLDTPGVGRKDEDTRMTLETAGLGAELLLLTIRNNVFDPMEIGIYSKMFPGGTHDLGLYPQDEVFCLYNEQPLVPMPSNVEASFQELTADQGLGNRVDVTRRLYSVDVLEERKKHGAYLYYQWVPVGIQQAAIGMQKLRQRADLDGEDVLDKDGKGYHIPGHQELAGECPGEEMQRLLDDLRLQAQVLYADPERICVPIETELREVAGALLEDARSRLAEITRQTEAEVAGVPAEELMGPELEMLREKITELTDFTAFANERVQAFQDSVDGFLLDIKKAEEALINAVTAQTARLEAKIFDTVQLNDEVMDSDLCHDKLVVPLRWQFIQCLKQWENDLVGEKLIEDIPNGIRMERCRTRLEEIFQTYTALAGEMQQFVLWIDAAPCAVENGVREPFQQDIGALTEKSAVVGAAVDEILRSYHASRSLPRTGFFIKPMKFVLRGYVRVKIHEAVRSQLRKVVEHDLRAYSGCIATYRSRLEQGDFANAQGSLRTLSAGLAQQLQDLEAQVLQQEQLARDARLYLDLELRTVSPRRDVAELETLMSELTFLKKESDNF